MNDQEEFLTPQEVARRLKVSKITIYRMAKKGEIPAVKFGNMWRISGSLFTQLKAKLGEK